MVICVDFDGTCVSHEFPYVGKDIGSVQVLKKLVENGHKLILWTMRSDNDKGHFLRAALNWFNDNEIPLYGYQVNPSQSSWTSSPKCYAELYIDDAALGCPLKYDPTISERAFVNWEEVEKMLKDKGIIQ